MRPDHRPDYRSPYWADPLHNERDERRTEAERQRTDADLDRPSGSEFGD